MALSGLTAPANITVWRRNAGTTIVNRKVETGSANVRPGALVTNGTSVGEAAVAGAGATQPLGWISFEDTPGQYIDGHSITTAFATDDIVAIVFGPGTGVQAVLADNNTIVEGSMIVSAANGQVQEADAIVVTITSGSATVLADKAAPDEAATGAYGSQGQIVARAAESVTTSGAVALLAVISLI